MVRVTGLRSFTDIVTRYGRGRGCDVCKPALASILASLGAGHVLNGEQATLQDTNDHVLANIQKDDTYSVVPRVPGGEITPYGLIAIGQIASEFGLYTKITGGQRIDLFGARIEQLPRIWAQLIDAGFESGHAYGKAVRTVKSCVGSTWCRYGVQDSVGMAVALELRYRGLRAPHKIKLGVSGCARECAEARGKDVGVIATENCWNLCVGGNGGFTPRHARLFAEALDDETLVRSIGRFIMYYVRAADRLQRTAAWLLEIEGGLGHVRGVVLADSLGIADDLGAAMATRVEHYVDEWRATSTTRTSCAGSSRSSTSPSRAIPASPTSSSAVSPDRRRRRSGFPPRAPVMRWSSPGRGWRWRRDDRADRSGCPASRPPRRGRCVDPGLPPAGPGAGTRCRGAGRGPSRCGLPHLGRRYARPRPPGSVQGSHVIARGIGGTRGDAPTIASPMSKQVFDLRTGVCLDDASVQVPVHQVRIRHGVVQVALAGQHCGGEDGDGAG